MRIGIVLPHNPVYSETFFKNKIKGLQEKGIDVTLYVKNYSPNETELCPIKVHPRFHKNAAIRLLQTIIILSKLLVTAARPTFRLINTAYLNGSSLVSAFKSAAIGASVLPDKLDWLHFGFATAGLEREFIGRAIGAKVAVSFRGYDLNIVPLMNPGCYNLLFKQLDKVHSISNGLLNEAFKHGLSQNIAIQKITPAINISDFDPAERSPRNGVLTIGRLHWIKGYEYTLMSFKELQKIGIEPTYNVIGDGVDFERLTFTKHQFNLNNVHFLGKKKHSEIPSILSNHEIYIQYSIQEGFCNSVLEAQAMGLLCIVSDAEGLAENVLDGVTGWVVPKRKPELLATKIEEVLNLPLSEKNKIREAAKLRVKNNFNLQKQRAEFHEFYGT